MYTNPGLQHRSHNLDERRWSEPKRGDYAHTVGMYSMNMTMAAKLNGTLRRTAEDKIDGKESQRIDVWL